MFHLYFWLSFTSCKQCVGQRLWFDVCVCVCGLEHYLCVVFFVFLDIAVVRA